MPETFKDLGLEFPLFEAPVSEAWQYRGKGSCSVCEQGSVQIFELEDGFACYDCIRGRKAAFVQDTEFGMVTRTEAQAGRTHGVPNLETKMFPVVPNGSGWSAAVIPSEYLWELIATPSYSTWQGENWLFCCSRPMVYVGPWMREDFERVASDGDAYREAVDMVHSEEVRYWEGRFPDVLSFYVFRCAECGKRRAHCDND